MVRPDGTFFYVPLEVLLAFWDGNVAGSESDRDTISTTVSFDRSAPPRSCVMNAEMQFRPRCYRTPNSQNLTNAGPPESGQQSLQIQR